MSVVYSTSPVNNSGNLTPMYQDWSPLPNPHSTELYYFASLNLAPAPFEIVFGIKDVIGLAETVQYSEFRLVAYQNYLTGNPMPWLDPACYTGHGYPNVQTAPMPVVSNGQNFSFTPVLQNLPLLPVGVYKFYHHFKLQGKNGSAWVDLYEYEHRTQLHVTNQPLYFSPATFLFQHLQGTPLPSKIITMHGENWKVIGNPKVILSSISSGVVVTEIDDPAGNYQTVHLVPGMGGVAQFRVTLTDYYDQIGNFDPSVLTGQLPVIAGESTTVGAIVYNIQVSAQPGLTSYPASLHFVAVKGITDAPAQNISFFSTQAYTITSSPWISTSVVTIPINGMLVDTIVVTPISSSNMALGTYTGFVVISTVVAGATVTNTIQVTYDVVDFLSSPYPDNLIFTLEPVDFGFSTALEGTYFQFDAVGRPFDYFGATFREVPIKQKVMPFQGKAALNLGKLLHGIMSRFPGPNNDQFQYRRAEVTITCEERNGNGTLARAASPFQLDVVAGLRRPYGVLDVTYGGRRVYPGGRTTVTVLAPVGLSLLRIFKNEQHQYDYPISASAVELHSHELNFSDSVPGDVWTCILVNSRYQMQTEKKPFIVFPPGRRRNMIVWENYWLCQSDLEFAGDFSIGTEYEQESQNLWQKLVEQLDILETWKTVKFTANTGWILQSDAELIDSLMVARRVWLVGSQKTLSLSPLAKSIVNKDSTRSLIEYSVEFQINKTFNEEAGSL